jgi:hypothetical protein
MKQNKVPMRRCVGCMQSKPKRELIRIVATPQGRVLLDPSGKANGRGSYICRDIDCFTKAQKKDAFTRNLNIKVSEEDWRAIESQLSELLRDK